MRLLFSGFLALFFFGSLAVAQAPMTNATVIKMTKAGLSEDVIISSINSHPGVYKTNPEDLIALKAAGVRDKVLAAILAKGSGVQTDASKPAKDAPSALGDVPVIHAPPNVVFKGVVEAEVGSGDLKPARFAKLLVIPAEVAGSVIGGINKMSALADKARGEAAGDDLELRAVEIECLKSLVKFKVALVTAGIDASRDPKADQKMLAIDADESGQFSFTGIKIEPFVIIAIGKAGMNGAIWVSDPITSSQQNTLKLDHPTLACYDAQAQF